jgi:hypothetical protein
LIGGRLKPLQRRHDKRIDRIPINYTDHPNLRQQSTEVR